MIRAIAIAVCLTCSAAWADPISIRVKSGLLVRPDDTYVEVDAGLYLNEEGRLAVLADINKMEQSNKNLSDALDRANKKILESSAYIPGFPTWLGIVLSAALSVATIVITGFAIDKAGSK